MTVTEKVIEILKKELDYESSPPAITQATTMKELLADSLAVVELTLSIEEQFEIDIPDEDIEPLLREDSTLTVQAIIDYVEQRLGRR